MIPLEYHFRMQGILYNNQIQAYGIFYYIINSLKNQNKENICKNYENNAKKTFNNLTKNKNSVQIFNKNFSL